MSFVKRTKHGKGLEPADRLSAEAAALPRRGGGSGSGGREV